MNDLMIVLAMFAMSWAVLWQVNKKEYVMAAMIFIGGMAALVMV